MQRKKHLIGVTLVEHKRKFGPFELKWHLNVRRFSQWYATKGRFRPHHHIGRPAGQLILRNPLWLIHFNCWTTELKVQPRLLPRSFEPNVETLQSKMHRVQKLTSNSGRQQETFRETTIHLWQPSVVAWPSTNKKKHAKLARKRSCLDCAHGTTILCMPRKQEGATDRRQSPSRRFKQTMNCGDRGGILIECLHNGGAMSCPKRSAGDFPRWRARVRDGSPKPFDSWAVVELDLQIVSTPNLHDEFQNELKAVVHLATGRAIPDRRAYWPIDEALHPPLPPTNRAWPPSCARVSLRHLLICWQTPACNLFEKTSLRVTTSASLISTLETRTLSHFLQAPLETLWHERLVCSPQVPAEQFSRERKAWVFSTSTRLEHSRDGKARETEGLCVQYNRTPETL